MSGSAPDLDLGLSLAGLPVAALPPELRGRGRDDVRLLVTDEAAGRHVDARFADLPSFLSAGDLLVLNRSRTLPASIPARLDARPLRLHLVRAGPGTWLAEPRTADGRHPWPMDLAPGQRLALPDGTVVAVGPRRHPRLRLWALPLPDGRVRTLMASFGQPIRYAYVERDLPLEAYQTVFARNPGSSEMPSAGRPFTAAMLERLSAAGVAFAFLTLHTALSSHEVEGDFDEHPLLPERYAVPPATAAAVAGTRRAGGRVIAVGTTVVRALAAAPPGGGRGWATAVVRPGRRPAAVDGLLTGLHAPRASHLALLEAFLPVDVLREAYALALERGYLWHEFGDLHLLLPARAHTDAEAADGCDPVW